MRMEGMKVGKGLDVFITREGYKYHLVSKVEKAENNKVFISLIASGKRIFRFLNTDEIEIIYRDGDRMWKWTHVKGGITKLDGEDVHFLQSNKDGISYNRRDAFRVPVNREVNLLVYTPKADEEQTESTESDKKWSSYRYQECDEFSGLEMELYNRQVIPVFLKDLSEGGMGIYSKFPLKEGTTVVLDFMTEMGKMLCKGEIIRSSSGNFGKYSLLYGCEFSQVDKNLGKYLFKLQREILHRERQGK